LIALWEAYPDVLEELKNVEAYIKKNISSRNELLSSVSGKLVDAGGKRLRPALVIISSKFGKYNREKTIPAAGALEILHTATLVHDDIVDRSKMRRGKLTVAEEYGNDIALYTGDFLFTKAVLMLSKGVSSDRLEIIARCIKSICEGEVDQFSDKFNVNTSMLSYLKRISRKTAALFASSCLLGAYLGKCPQKTEKSLAKYGFYYGMAFQIRDDLYDYISNPVEIGKPVGGDIAKGIVTIPAIYAMRNDAKLKDLIANLFEKKKTLSESEVEMIIRGVKESKGVEEAKRMLNTYIDRGLNELRNLPDNGYRSLLQELMLSLKI